MFTRWTLRHSIILGMIVLTVVAVVDRSIVFRSDRTEPRMKSPTFVIEREIQVEPELWRFELHVDTP